MNTNHTNTIQFQDQPEIMAFGTKKFCGGKQLVAANYSVLNSTLHATSCLNGTVA